MYQVELDNLIHLFHAGRFAELEGRARSLAKQFPASGMIWKLLCASLQMQGKNALPELHTAATLLPSDAEAQNNLAKALQDAGRHEEAETVYRRAIRLCPKDAELYNNLGTVLYDLRQFEQAIASYRKALTLNPLDTAAYNNLGVALHELARFSEAVESFGQALAINPRYAEAHNHLGMSLRRLGQLDAAIASYQRAYEIKPDYAEAYCNLANLLSKLGRMDEAVSHYRRAIAIKPNDIDTRSSLLFALSCTLHHSSPGYMEELKAYGRLISGRVAERYAQWQCARDPVRLRVGVVSGDLRKHPVCYALQSFLAHLDTEKIELTAYSTCADADEVTAQVKPYFSAWRSLDGVEDANVARLIHEDGVHVLLDLSGHTTHNRLPVFAWKPAPIQASWLGYFASTGVEEMDFLLTSEVAVPTQHQAYFTERIWYLPDIWLCFSPPDIDLPVAPLPAIKKGHLTFACFQRLNKISGDVLAAWGRILSRLPDAQLLLANSQLGLPDVAAQFTARLRQYGIDPAQVELRGAVATRAEYFTRYGEIDAVLDTFPYPGVTTTCEALWMGVPTLTLGGETLLSRQGAGVLTPAGLGEWVAETETEYVEKAIALTRDGAALSALRAGLRQRVTASPVYDTQRFARHFEAAMWGMWQQWKDKQPS